MEQADKIKDRENTVRFMSLKVGKLTSAIYILTNFLSDNEPMKWKVRSRALDLFSHLQKSLSIASDFKTFELEKFVSLVNELVAILDLSVASQLISEMNFGLLKREYLKLIDVMTVANRNLAGVIAEASSLTIKDIKDKGQRLDSGLEVKDITTNTTARPYKVNNRVETILNFLREKGDSSVRDIARVIPELSAKTIQRELNTLLQVGKVKREGDRRWSRYSLPQGEAFSP